MSTLAEWLAERADLPHRPGGEPLRIDAVEHMWAQVYREAERRWEWLYREERVDDVESAMWAAEQVEDDG